ncbi:MAG: helix-turn-helix transcriptional regulator [Alphaproteobacteria bacterium]|nr:helix-turn-helix transcriptional regulator [Alphaproteobacteria bacterium]
MSATTVGPPDDQLPNGMTARGPLTGHPVRVVLVAGALSLFGTSSTGSTRLVDGAVVTSRDATSGGSASFAEPDVALEAEQREFTRAAVSELRRLSGLTWGQVARLFGVSRRSVHFWVSGKPMSSEHEEHLHRLLGVVRRAARGAAATRTALLSEVNGEPVLEMLSAHRYADAADALGEGTDSVARTRTPLSPAASAGRRPLPPEVLAASHDDWEHPVEGRARPARTNRGGSRGRS